MAAQGPQLRVVPARDWLAHLAAENIEPWYHNPRLWARMRGARLGFLRSLAARLAPRGYARPDRDGIPDSDDLVALSEPVFILASRAADRLMGGNRPEALPKANLDAFRVAWHEYLHCKVPWPGTVPAREHAILCERYDHPDTAWKGLRHALRLGLPVNAFTGLLRRRNLPSETMLEAANWLQKRALERQMP